MHTKIFFKLSKNAGYYGKRKEGFIFYEIQNFWDGVFFFFDVLQRKGIITIGKYDNVFRLFRRNFHFKFFIEHYFISKN